MTIGVDGNEANVEKKVGVSVYAFELLHYFKSQANETTKFVIYLRFAPRTDLPKSDEYFTYQVVNGSLLWSQIFLPLSLHLNKRPDVFFAPAHYAPRFCPCPTVVTIHDLSYFYYPQEFLKEDLHKLKNWTKYSLNNATHVIGVSNNTKDDIEKFYSISKDKVTVIYNGFNEKKKSKATHNEIRATNIEEIISNNYFLYVGTIQPRKNIEKLIEAFDEFIKEKPDYKLVIVGKKGWLYEKIFAKVTELQLEKHIIFTGYLLDSDLGTLYQHAQSFVLPSLYEGFGIPLLEAMSFGCPIISSNTASLPEIGGDACLYFNPNDTMDMRDKINTIVSDTDLRKELIERGKQRVKKFSWDKCGSETLDVLKNVALSKGAKNLA